MPLNGWLILVEIEILCTGDEILSGKTTNTNYSYIAQRLTENALNIVHGTNVGDDRDALKRAFLQAADRADAVIVNGGLGPTVDDLSQEIAAETAGVDLVCFDEWLESLKRYYENRGRKMPQNNTKQAMLPAGSELIDNPIGTACGFALDIKGSRFFFTPGVPREMKRMLNEQILPRLLKLSGTNKVTRLKRFHTFGIGESRADQLLANIIPEEHKEVIKLGFQTHFPQLETKLSVQANDQTQLDDLLEPVASEMRARLGNAILTEDDQTVESLILDKLRATGSGLCCMEMGTNGMIANRLLNAQKNDSVVSRCYVSPHIESLCKSVNMRTDASDVSPSLAAAMAESQTESNNCVTHSLVVLTSNIDIDNTTNLAVSIGIAGPDGTRQRLAILPGRPGWTSLGAAELGLDCLRRYLTGLPVDEKIDFEQR